MEVKKTFQENFYFFLPCVKLIKEKQFRRKLCSVITFFCIFLFMCESGKKNQEQISFTEQSFSFICETEWYFVHSQEKNLLFLVWNWLKKHFCFFMWNRVKEMFSQFPKKKFLFSFTQKNLYFSRFFISVKMKKLNFSSWMWKRNDVNAALNTC